MSHVSAAPHIVSTLCGSRRGGGWGGGRTEGVEREQLGLALRRRDDAEAVARVPPELHGLEAHCGPPLSSAPQQGRVREGHALTSAKMPCTTKTAQRPNITGRTSRHMTSARSPRFVLAAASATLPSAWCVVLSACVRVRKSDGAHRCCFECDWV